MKNDNTLNKAFHPLKDWRKRKPRFIICDLLFSMITVILVVVSFLIDQKSLLSVALVFLGLTFINRGLEYSEHGHKTYYKINFFTAWFLIIIGILSYWF